MPPSKNASLLRSLLVEADTLASHAAKSEFPVLLRPIAERRRVTSVEFCPLLVDAMLTTHPNGFRILFNSNGEHPSDLQERYRTESRERTLTSRLRFSLAHELAHTFFYDLTQTPPKVAKCFKSGGGRTALENLELNCNRLASRLLLPTPMLKDAFLRLKVIDPESILNLAHRAGVSVEALVRRLHESNSLFIKRYFRGCIVLVKESSDEITIRAIAKPHGLNSLAIAQSLSRMRPGKRWDLKAHDGLDINPATLPPVSSAMLAVETQTSTSLKHYNIAVRKAGRFDTVTSYLIVFEEIELS